MSENKKDPGEEIAGKILTALLVVAGAYLVFKAAVGGVFSLIMGGNSGNAIYVLFYGGLAALAVIALIGAGSGCWLWRRSKAEPAGTEQASPAARGLNIGLVVVVLAAALIVGSYIWGVP